MTDATPSADDRDQLSRFLLEDAGVRGVLVHLDDAWQQIRRRAARTVLDILFHQVEAQAPSFEDSEGGMA